MLTWCFKEGQRLYFLIRSSHGHYYRTHMLFRLETSFNPGFPTGTTLSGLKIADFSPGWHNRDKNNSISWLGVPDRDKRWKKSHFCSSYSQHHSSASTTTPPSSSNSITKCSNSLTKMQHLEETLYSS